MTSYEKIQLPIKPSVPLAVLYAVYYLGAQEKLTWVLEGDIALLSPSGEKIQSGPDAVLQSLFPSPSSSSLPTTLSTTPGNYESSLSFLAALDQYLTLRSFVSSPSGLGASDFLVLSTIKGSSPLQGLLKGPNYPHVSRWLGYVEAACDGGAVLKEADKKRNEGKKSHAASQPDKEVNASFDLGLDGAEKGKVVTRFPPEPSGYLHIGHTKAAILNEYFARHYDGKFLVRFDDTNPSNEKEEFQDSILADIKMLELTPDQISYTSDHFDTIYDFAVKAIKDGKAYADDTPKEQMQKERFDGTKSARRDATIEENLARFEEMKEGTEEGRKWCLRAKLSVDNPNKALRDPVIYRVNLQAHHRTGEKWKVYPTYDFACPIVDSIEGITHALRTNEYRDRNPQYEWMLEAVGLRKVQIWDFGRLNFVYTLLSKRKLKWFVEQNLVDGWDDPRFPTVRGIKRRGLSVEALKLFMLQQGPSQAFVNMDWESLWSLNKRLIDPVVPRYWFIPKENAVPGKVSGVKGTEVKDVLKHKKNESLGTKKTVYGEEIWFDQDDAKSFAKDEEITLMDWGNAYVRTIEKDGSGVVTSLGLELHLEGDFKKTKKKVHWLIKSPEHPLLSVTYHDYDYLITKKKLEEEDQLIDFVNPSTKFSVTGWTDQNVEGMKEGDRCQFERKGYFILDKLAGKGGEREFILIPDGKQSGGQLKAPVAEIKKKAETKLEKPKGGYEMEVTTKMYRVDDVIDYTGMDQETTTKMYKVDRID
ncbi:glutamate-tRNA ligase [Atractiella rhizophila]|nr:glutamate-tRNA ligase [Atractiella rhizophila]